MTKKILGGVIRKSCFPKGFTLIELLVVVIIIAILAAVAVPQYKRATLKARFSTVMPMAKAIADAQEVYYQGRQMYALSQEELDVTPVSAENTSVALSTQAEEDKYAYVAAQRSDVPGARYIVYQKYSPMFASTIHCEADENNADALWLCEKGLNGTEISGSVNTANGSYRTFLLSGTAGATDKLPTSISKLKAQICAGVSEENCIVNETSQTITTQNCGNNISYTANGTAKTGNGCAKTVYDSEGNVISSTTSVCNSSRATWNGEKCVPTTGDYTYTDAAAYELTYDENGNRIGQKFCVRYSSGCTEGYDWGYDENGNRTSTKSRSCSGALDPVTLACPENGYKNGTEQIYDTQGREVEYMLCSAINSTTGECTQYSTGGYNALVGYSAAPSTRTTYDENGDQTITNCTEWTGTECTGSWEVRTKRVGSNYINCAGLATAAGVCSGGSWTGPGGRACSSVDIETATCN